MPTKEGKRKFRRLQFYLPSHKSEILKLISGVKEFQLDDEDGNKLTPETTREGNNALEFDLSDEEEPSLSTSGDGSTPAPKQGEVVIDKLTCGSCGVTVDDLEELRQHYKHDWHRYNVKRKLHGQAPVTDSQFYDLMGNFNQDNHQSLVQLMAMILF